MYFYLKYDEMKVYTDLKELHTTAYEALLKRCNAIGSLRLLMIIISLLGLIGYFKTKNDLFMIVFILTLICFFILVKVHGKMLWKVRVKKELIAINQREIDFLSGKDIPFEHGVEYTDASHPYSFDLDIFGKNSLFHFLNRTQSYIGKKALAESLLKLLPDSRIVSTQEAIKELTPKIEFRQDISVLAGFTNDSKSDHDFLLQWGEHTGKESSPGMVILSYVFPFITLSSIVLYVVIGNDFFYHLASLSFMVNLFILYLNYNKIRKEIRTLEKAHLALRHYGLIIEKIEKETFSGSELNHQKELLSYKGIQASAQLKHLSGLLDKLNHINNGIAAIVLNGLYLCHLHLFNSLMKWKKQYSSQIAIWLEVIGEFEKLNSYANFSFNNPEFAYPELNADLKLKFKDLGHPLIPEKHRVCNDVGFVNHKFIILTGSNMAGKSTFLRTLGVNMVLAGAGSPVCAASAEVHPLHVLVSMRLSDSLHENESYFFAEIKRLKEILDKLKEEVCFVILDEILKGTNSEDKRTGTVEIVKQVMLKGGIGAIATHDLKICETTADYPTYLTNKCFEVHVVNDELSFDYKLMDGICKNKSATFLMKKMDII